MTPPTKIKILNVDDYETGRHARSQILQQAGYEVAEAATGNDGLRLAVMEHPQLVLLDVSLPDINGYEVCRRIKADPATALTPVIQISAT